ncbi:MAG: hypothetical protein CMQ43_07185 [Gammaproteobacteria bacterium]|nr:hypothetical protein [Gammaproteobacteria bacterium]
MATGREHFALDWIKGELLETLNTARGSLEAFAEALESGAPTVDADGQSSLLRDCVNALHQIHGTLVMLELRGVTLLADHLERVSESLMDGGVADVADASQHLMQGILELPGYLDELQQGMPDSDAALLPLVNELRRHLGEAPLTPSADVIQLYGVAGDAALQRFQAIDGVEKTRRIRGVYQQVLLNLLKGGDLSGAIDTLRKVAQGMGRVCEGTPFEAQWQAFGEFVESLAAGDGSLDADAVKLLRRVDSEIREIGQSGVEALRRPVPLGLVRQLLDGAAARGRTSELLGALQEAAAQGDSAPSMSLSGRQALISAATALREELGGIKDRLDLFVRGGRETPAVLGDLAAPLKQIASTLSLLGFESSKSIVLDQVEVLNAVVESGRADEGTILTVAGALVQVDENLASLTQTGKGEVEQITDEAQRAVAQQTRDGLETVKQAIVDYVSSQWDVRHLQNTPDQLDEISGALRMIPLAQAAELVQRCQHYVRLELMAGHVPSWEELDRLADALSGIDYYLERLASDSPGGAEDVLELAARSIDGLAVSAAPEAPAAQPAADAQPPATDEVAPAGPEAAAEPAPQPEEAGHPAPDARDDNVEPLFGGARDVDVSAVGEADEDEEPALEHEADEDFDLSNGLFDEIAGEVRRDAGSADAGDAAGQAAGTEAGAPTDTDADADAANEADAGAGAPPGAADFELDLEDLDESVPEPTRFSEDSADEDLFEVQLDEPGDDAGFDLDDAAPADAASADAGFADSTPPGRDAAADVDDGPDPVSLLDEVGGADAGEEPAPTFAAPPPEAPQAPAGPAALPAGLAGLADEFESDEEIVEIFSEEVDEVVETIDGHLDGWASDPDDETHLAEIRRAFHTLKGSGRMVGANVLGEMAWSVENMLNRVLDDTVPVNPEFVAVAREARLLTPSLRDTFERREAPDMAPVGRIMERADLLASGGSLADAVDDEAGDAVLPAEREAGSAAAASAPAADAEVDEDRLLFLDEADSHVESLAAASRDDGFVLDDESMRALHTLSGSAALAGLTSLSDLAGPTYELAQALRQSGAETRLDGEAADFFRQVVDALAGSVEAMRAGREPDDHLQLMVEADRLMLEAEQARPAGTLMSLPALASIMKAHDLLDAWYDGAVDMALADEIRGALADIEAVAGDESQPAVAALAGALREAHERFEFESLSEDARAVFLAGHDALLEQFDALAADQTPQDAAGLRDTLMALAPQAPADVAAETVDAPDQLAEASETDLESGTEGAETVDADEAGRIELPTADELSAVAREAEPEPVQPAAPAEPEPARAEQPSAPAVAASAADADLVPEDVDADIIEVFFEEADELLEALDQGISDWQSEPDNRLHLENLLRALHTLKGGARLSGLARLGDETHEFESYLIDFQDSQRPAEAGLFDELQTRYDDIADLVGRTRAAIAGEPPAGETREVETPDDEAPSQAASVTPPPAPEPAEPAPGRVDQPEPAVAEAPATGNVAPLRRPAATQAEPSPPAEAPDRAEPVAAQARGPQEMVRVGAGLLENLVNLAGESSIIRARVEQGMSDFTNALDEMETTIERLREQLRRLEIETETQVLFRQERLEGPSYEDFDPLEMDRYSQLQQLSRALGESASDMLDLKETLLFKAREAETLLLQQARVNTELQEGLMRSRMVPFSRLVPRLKRTVRQVAKELGKDVELHAFNVEGELDRSLLERMVPPLEHMLRNAVDHGIEQPDRRRAVGKSESGRIDLRLSREGGDVVIEISDDGAGIDVERVRQKAVERGLMAADADLRDDEISQFVLAPGFSTAASVTQISGRGVGMDVVHSEVKQLGGSIAIFSEPGRGTRFTLRVPFTVSVNRALMVSVGEDLYAIPLNTIEGIVLLAPEELERLYAPDGNTFEYAGVPYRVQYLGSFLGREYHAQPMGGSVPVVLVRSGEHAVAVHVDGVQGSREIVVKSLGPQFAGVGGISGATILGDGSVVVILDLLALIRTQRGPSIPSGKRSRAGAARTTTVMVVDDSVTVRKVTSRLLERQGMDVIVAKDGVEAVSLLQEQRPDVMLLDIEMPRMDGFEVLRQVRHDERLKDLPIVMISSRTGAKHQERAAGLGVSRFLGKPFQENELLSTIDELVR